MGIFGGEDYSFYHMLWLCNESSLKKKKLYFSMAAGRGREGIQEAEDLVFPRL